MQDKLEIKGRLWLWSSAISECQTLLELADRANIAMKDERLEARLLKYTEGLNEFARIQPDHEEGIQKHSHSIAYRATHSEEFPTFQDCLHTKNYSMMLAIVFFCQLFNQGFAQTGIAAANNKQFIDAHLGKILDKVFVTSTERMTFDQFCDQLKNARNTMIGHADANAFEIVHGDQLSTMKHYTKAIKGLDIEYWRSFLESLRLEIMRYSIEVRTS